jgi:hypothetical protein
MEKRDGVIIEFYENGVIKSFRSADIYHDSQNIKFHEKRNYKKYWTNKKRKRQWNDFLFRQKRNFRKKQ